MPQPSIGDTVIYTSKIDNGPGNEVRSPAMIIRTRETCVEAVFDRWGPQPQAAVAADGTVHNVTARPADVVAVLPDDYTVDLVVFGLGSTYREYNVAQGDGLGQWTWPAPF